MSEDALRRKLARAERRIAILETLADDRTRELYLAMEQLREAADFLHEIYMTVPGALVVFDRRGIIDTVNETTSNLLGYPPEELIGRSVSIMFEDGQAPSFEEIETSVTCGAVLRTEKMCRSKTGLIIPALFSATLLTTAGQCGDARGVVCVLLDIRDRKQLEVELRQAHKLEAVGRLAAGVAHEINTPVQFVGDSIHFLRDAAHDITDLIGGYRGLVTAVLEGADAAALATRCRRKEEEIDLEYLSDHVPRAFDRTIEGLNRVATIVRSMKEFAHPDTREMSSVDINQAIESTLVIARNEYKYVADVQTDFGDLPRLRCHAGDINQVVLNVIVNAAHAIADVVGASGKKGTITVRTEHRGDHIIISVSDTGTGIPASIRDRVFDPFFTTKDVGKGTGQGLALARTVIVDRHGGSLDFESEDGHGTTFFMTLPLAGPTKAAA